MEKLKRLLETTGDDSMGTLPGFTGVRPGNQEVMERLRKLVEVDVSFVRKVLDSLHDKVMHKDLSNTQLEKIFNNAFKSYKIKFIPSKQVSEFNCQLVSAAAVEDGYIEIEYAKKFAEIFAYEELWQELVDCLTQFLSHELVHRNQFNDIKKEVGKKKYSAELGKVISKPRDDAQDYLSNALEVEAFAREAVEEFRNAGNSNRLILLKIRNPSASKPETSDSGIFTTYLKYFSPGDATLAKFLTYMKEYANGKEKAK